MKIKKMKTYFSHSKLLTPPKKRPVPLRLLSQERFKFLHHSSSQLLRSSITLSLRGSTDPSEQVVGDLARESIDEEGDARAEQSVLLGWAGRRGQEVGGVGVSDELGDDGGFGDYVSIVGYAGDETALSLCCKLVYCYFGCLDITYRVDLEIPRLTWLGQIDNNLFIVQTSFFQRDVCALRIGAAVVGIQDDLGRRHSCVLSVLFCSSTGCLMN